MKVTLFLSSLWLFFASLFAPAEKAVLTGRVTDGKDPLIGATILAKKDRQFIKGAQTDVDGKYRLELEPGAYDIEFTYTGFVTHRILEVPLKSDAETKLDNIMEARPNLDEVIVTSYQTKETRYAPEGAMRSSSSDRDDYRRPEPVSLGASSAKAKPATKAKDGKPAPAPTTVEGEEVKIKGARSTGTDYYIDGIRVTGGEPPVMDLEQPKIESGRVSMAEKPDALKKAPAKDALKWADDKPSLAHDEVLPEETTRPSGTPATPAPRAGLLTAGEWNDLHNWNHHWVDLLADGETDTYQKMYGFYPRQRYAVLLTNENEVPIPDALAQLKSADGKILWEARTDNTGKAELWAGLFSSEKETAKLQAEVWVNGNKHELKSLKPAAEGFNKLEVNAECNAPKNVDIVWAVDATGSMGDEIEYLKTELLDVIGRAKSRNPALEYRMGTVFYRDKGDEYITKSSGLSPDIAKTVDFIQKQFAGGGGDYPEAVHSALEEAIYGQKWSEKAIARICFLVLDASPHQEEAVQASLQKSIREAARLGIRIVPIAASGVQKDTEFLMKFFGLATNGSYVFLTDHSGIGGKHLEPTTDEYKVEPLNNLLVRLITEYSSIQTCEGKSEIRFENDPQQQPGPTMQALYYPNPAVDQFTLELPFEVQSVTIYDAEGKAVRKLEKPVAGPNVIQINDLAAGFYTIRILNNGLMQSGKLMVVRS